MPSSRVYPRAGGETVETLLDFRHPCGLSPRGRGNPRPDSSLPVRRRSIPARAGKPGDGPAFMPGRGLSPRGRGNLYRVLRGRASMGSIPARAGKPISAFVAEKLLPVYPRAGGETSCFVRDISGIWGLSPRGRGNRDPEASNQGVGGSIPARAGKPSGAPAAPPAPAVYPRAGGETDRRLGDRQPHDGLSPRGRGNRLEGRLYDVMARSIPARAGKPPTRQPGRPGAWVYPRAGGETSRSRGAGCGP